MTYSKRHMIQQPKFITYFQNGENLLRWTNPFAPTHNVKFHAWETMVRCGQ